MSEEIRIRSSMLLATMLVGMIRQLDEHVFGLKSIQVGCTTQVIHGHTFACYCPATKREPEVYCVHPDNLNRHVKKRLKDCRRMFRRNGAFFSKDPKRMPFPSVGEFLAMVAAHEVRHRMQTYFRGTMRLFALGTGDQVKDPLARNLIRIIEMVEEKHPQFTPPNKRDPLERGDEFDAKVIELLVLHVWRGKRSFSEVGRIVRSESDKMVWKPSRLSR